MAQSKKKRKVGNGVAKKGAGFKKKSKAPIKQSKPSAKPKSAAVVTTAAVTSAVFKPIDDRVLIAVDEASETTAGGIIIPGNVDSRPNRGLILAKGPGRKSKKGRIRPLDVNVGDRVLFPEFAGTKIQIGGEDFLIMREEELLGIVTL